MLNMLEICLTACNANMHTSFLGSSVGRFVAIWLPCAYLGKGDSYRFSGREIYSIKYQKNAFIFYLQY